MGRFAHRPKAAAVKVLPQVPYAVRHMRVSATIGAELLTMGMRNVLDRQRGENFPKCAVLRMLCGDELTSCARRRTWRCDA